MRLLRDMFDWWLCPQTPGIYRFFYARMAVFDYFQGTGSTYPRPFRPLNRSLGSLPSVALSRPAQVLPGWTTSTSPCNNFSTDGDYPLNFVSHSRGSLQTAQPHPSGKYSILPSHSSQDIALAIRSRSHTMWPIVTRSWRAGSGPSFNPADPSSCPVRRTQDVSR
jgi:hypothetical protein